MTGSSYNGVFWGSVQSPGSVSVTILDESNNVIGTANHNIEVLPALNPYLLSDFSPICIDPTKPSDISILDCFSTCEKSVTRYIANGSPGSSYTWQVTQGDIVYSSANGDTIDILWDPVPSNQDTTHSFIFGTETNTNGCTAAFYQCISIFPKPVALIGVLPDSANGGASFCLKEAVHFIDLTNSGFPNGTNSWSWDFGDGSSSIEQNPKHTYAAAGNYTVTLVTFNNCYCSDTTTFSIVIDPYPAISIECPSIVCEGDTNTYYTDALCSPYEWTVTGGTILGGASTEAVTVAWGDGQATGGFGFVSLNGTYCDSVCADTATVIIPIVSDGFPIIGDTIICVVSTAWLVLANQGYYSYSLPAWPGTTYGWEILSGSATLHTDTSSNTVFLSDTLAPDTIVLGVSYSNALAGCTGLYSTITIVVREKFGADAGETAFLCLDDDAYAHIELTPSSYPFDYTIIGPDGSVQGSGTTTDEIVFLPTDFGITNVVISPSGGVSPFCNDTMEVPIIRFTPPQPIDTIIGPTLICPGRPYTYTATVNNPNNSLIWYTQGGTPNMSSGPSVTVVWNPSHVDPYLLAVQEFGGVGNCGSELYILPIDPLTNQVPDIVGPDTVCSDSYHIYETLEGADRYNWSIAPDYLGSITSGELTDSINVQWNYVDTPLTAVITVLAYYCGSTTPAMETFDVVILPSPPPIIIADTTVCSGDGIMFSTPTVGSQYDWDFGDGSSDTGNPVWHSFFKDSTFAVTLTVTDANGCPAARSTAHLVYVKPSPVAVVTTPNNVRICDTTNFADTLYASVQGGSGNYGYQWFELSSSALLGTGTTLIVSQLGDYYVVAIDSTNGCTDTSAWLAIYHFCDSGQICPADTADYGNFTWSLTGPGCGTVSFTSHNFGSATADHWSFDDPVSGANNSSTLANPTHQFSSSGFFKVRYWYQMPRQDSVGGYCLYYYMEPVKVPIFADFNTELACGGTPGTFEVRFNDLSNYVDEPIVSWAWDITGPGGPYTLGTANPTLGLAPGTYTATLTVGNGTESCEVTKTFTVPDVAVADFTAPSTWCQNGVVQFTDLSTGSIINWFWDLDDDAFSALQNPQKTYQIDDAKNITLYITDVFGCENSTNQSVFIEENTLFVTIVPLDSTGNCPFDTVTLFAEAIDGYGGNGYAWNNGQTNDTIYVSESGFYMVTVTDNIGCVATHYIDMQAIDNLPEPIVTGDPYMCSGSNEPLTLFALYGPNITFEWFEDGVLMPGRNGPTLLLNSGDYPMGSYDFQVVLTDTLSGCTDTSRPYTVTAFAQPNMPTVSVSTQCHPAAITLEATAMPGEAISWSNGANGPQTVVYGPGSYYTWVTSDQGCMSDAQETFIDSFAVFPSFTGFPSGCYEFCDNAAPTLVAPEGEYAHWEWLLNGISIESGSGDPWDPRLPVSGTVILILETYEGCRDTSDEIILSALICDSCDMTGGIDSIAYYGLNHLGEPEYGLWITLQHSQYYGSRITAYSSNGNLQPWADTLGGTGFDTIYKKITDRGFIDSVICVKVWVEYDSLLECSLEFCTDIPKCQIPDHELVLSHCLADLGDSIVYLFHVSFDYTDNDFSDIMISATSGLGNVDINSPVQVAMGPNDVIGTITLDNQTDGTNCIDFVLRNTVTGNLCYFTECFVVTACEVPICEMEASEARLYCTYSVPYMYGFSFRLESQGNLVLNLFSSLDSGAVLFFTPNTLTGSDWVEGFLMDYIDTNPGHDLCFTAYAYEPYGDVCQYEICLEVPECSSLDSCTAQAEGVELEIVDYECLVGPDGMPLIRLTGQFDNTISEDVNVYISTPDGYTYGLVSQTIFDGTVVDLDFYFTGFDPNLDSTCFYLYVMDDENEYYCYSEFCFEMPQCSYMKMGNTAVVDLGTATKKGFLAAMPNPAHNKVTVSYAMPGKGTVSLRLLDLHGRMVLAADAHGASGILDWDVSGLPGGVYLLYGVQGAEITGAQRLVIVR